MNDFPNQNDFPSQSGIDAIRTQWPNAVVVFAHQDGWVGFGVDALSLFANSGKDVEPITLCDGTQTYACRLNRGEFEQASEKLIRNGIPITIAERIGVPRPPDSTSITEIPDTEAPTIVATDSELADVLNDLAVYYAVATGQVLTPRVLLGLLQDERAIT